MKIEGIKNNNVKMIPTALLSPLVELDTGMTVQRIRQRLQRLWNFGIWHKHFLIGFFSISMEDNEYGTQTLVVHYASTYQGTADWKISKWIQRWCTKFALTMNATEVGFYTRRNPQAFCRALGKGWKLDSYVLKKTLTTPKK